MKGIRLQIVLAKGGVASRRAAEALITSGYVSVNGRVVTELGTRVDPTLDRITVDGRDVAREPLAYYLLNKPKGYVTTASDPEGRATVFDLLNEQGITCRVAPPPGQVLDPAKARPQQSAGLRLFAVGRLDYNTEGALLLTNDGELAHALMHPSRGVAKFYHAKLRGEVMAMRQRMVDAHPNKTELFDLKHDRGGLIDVEFIVQYLVLGHAFEHASLTGNLGNIALLKMAGELGLIPADHAAQVADTYREYRRLQHGLRLNNQASRVDRKQVAESARGVRALWNRVFDDTLPTD